MKKNSVNICGLDYEIIYSDTLIKEKQLSGEIDYINQVITLDGTVSDEKKTIILYHEIVHGIFQELGYTYLHDDEVLVSSISSMMYHSIKSIK